MNSPAIRFNGQVEYAFDGDFAKIGAHLNIDAPEQLANENLSLQLWACEDQFDTAAPQNTCVASMPLYPQLLSGFYSDQAPALPPAGNRDYLIALALVGDSCERGTQIHDVALFNNRQLFTQPRIEGRVDWLLMDGAIELKIESINNPREEHNLSGSLSLEVWALDTPYAGGAFSGFQLSACELGALNGGDNWHDNLFTLNMEAPPTGEWSLVLMLREWTPSGYVTRDYRELTQLSQQPTAPVAIAAEQPLAAEPVAPAEPEKVTETTAAKVETAPQKKPGNTPKAKRSGESVSKKAATKSSKAKTKARAESKESNTPVSINKADIEALAAVKGLSPRLAKAIIAERPFADLDQLKDVRGLGPKSVAKLKKFLSL